LQQRHYLTVLVGLVLLSRCGGRGDGREQSPLGVVGLGAGVGGGGQSPPDVVCGDCLDNTGAHLEFPLLDGVHSGAVLFSGYRNGRCQNDVFCIGTPDVYLGDVEWGPHPDNACPKYEVVAFAAGRAPKVLPGTAPFEFPSPDSDWFPAPALVKVHLWEIDEGAWADHESQTLTAKAVFEKVGSGITLEITLSPRQPVDPTDQPNYYCNQSSADAVRVLPGYDAERINVYYVASIWGPYEGLTCQNPNDAGGAWDILFIQNGATPNVLAHELGHALGLNRTATFGVTEMRTGDSDELDMGRAFGDNNLMNYHKLDPTSLTIGQIYRMHFDVRSWLHKGKAAVAGGYPRQCQDSPVAEGDCPPLALSAPEAWP